MSDNVKYIGPSKLPAPKASSQHQQLGLASAGDDIISVDMTNATVKSAMSRRITRLDNAQRGQMHRLCIHLKASEEAKKRDKSSASLDGTKNAAGATLPRRAAFL